MAKLRWSTLAILGLSLAATSAFADDPPKPAPPKAAKAKRTPLPVKISVVAKSPDPPWVLHIENQSDVPVRIPADSRLLRFEMKVHKKGGASKNCAPPAAMSPSSFPEKRELYLRPGEIYEEEIDPRLYCFGESSADYLRPGTSMVPHFGFGPGWAAKEPFAAQSADDADNYAPLKDISGEEFTLPGVPASQVMTPPAHVDAPPPAPPPPIEKTSATTPGKKGAPEAKTDAGDDEDENPVVGTAPVVDKNAGHIDIYVHRFVDASAPRDVVLTIRAKNEGRRKLAAVLRGRMLHFHVEELGADNRVLRDVDCIHQAAAHGIATEMVSEVQPGRQIEIPLLISEICPRGTFTKPGLYRISPRLDPTQVGESLKKDPWLGATFARQSALVRLATGPGSFYYASPRTGPIKLPPGQLLVAGDAPPSVKSDKTPPHKR